MESHRIVVILIALSSIFSLCCVALSGILVWHAYNNERDSSSGAGDTVFGINSPPELIREKFPGYFRTPAEQTAFVEGALYAPTYVKVNRTSAVYKRCFVDQHCQLNKTYTRPITTFRPSFIATTTPTGQGRRRRRAVTPVPQCPLDNVPEADLTFNGCCVTDTRIITPTTLPTPGANSVNVTIVQFPTIKQYFSIQDCCQANGCTGCQCTQVYYTTSAVIVSGKKYIIGYVQVPGCCQCLNTSPSGES